MDDDQITAPLASRSSDSQWPALVRRIEDVADGLARVTLGAEEFHTFEPTGLDECCGLFLPPAGMPLVVPPISGMNIHSGLQCVPAQQRPSLRWYTVSKHRPASGEVDVDIVQHDANSPGMLWLQRLRENNTADALNCVGFRTGASGFPAYSQGPSASAGQSGPRLVVADETAAPAAAAIYAGISPSQRQQCTVVIETARPGALPPELDGCTVVSPAQSPGLATARYLHELHPTGENTTCPWVFAWVAGEAALATNFRRHLVDHYSMARKDVFFSGYWRRGQAAL